MGRCEPRMRISEHRSLRAALMSDPWPRPILSMPPRIAALIGVKNPRAAGRMMDACRSLPTNVWSAFNGTDVRRRIRWISLMYVAAFVGGSWTVCLIPSNMKPTISLSLVKLPLPFSSFLWRWVPSRRHARSPLAGEDRVDTMNGGAPDMQDVTSILCFHRCIAEVIDIDLQELGRHLRAGAKRHVLDSHLRLKWVCWKIDVGIHQVLGDVMC